MSYKSKIAFTFIFVTFLVGCTTPEQAQYQAQQRQYQAQQAQLQAQQAREAYFVNLNAKCDGYGFQRGTTAFAQCLQQAEQQDSMDSALRMQRDALFIQQNAISNQQQQPAFQQANCFASGRLNC